MSAGGILKNFTLIDSNGNPVTIEMRDSRFVLEISDPDTRHLLEQVAQTLADLRDQGTRAPDFMKVGGQKLIGADSNSQATVIPDGASVTFPRTANPLSNIFGWYGMGFTASIGASAASGSTVFSVQNGGPNIMLLTRMSVIGFVTVGFTAIQQMTFGLFHARSFLVPDSGGAQIGPNKFNFKRTGFRPMALGDIRVAALGPALTPGVRTVDAQPYAVVGGSATTSAGLLFNQSFLYDHGDMTHNQIIVAANEGLLINTTIATPAAGTAVIVGAFDWFEVPAWQ